MRRLTLAAQAIKSAMPQAISIDNYLHTHADDPDIVVMGKVGIAVSILEAERASAIYGKEQGKYFIEFARSTNTWHNTFCKMLTESVQRTSLERLFENVTFITFNYDRCIEHYVMMWLMNYMGLPYDEACGLVKTLRIFHPYGQVGKLPWQVDGVGVDFGEDPDEYNIQHTAAQIRTFTERVDDDVMLTRMRRAISHSERLVYLGFSFGQMNMDLMAIEESGPNKTVYATTLNVSESNKTHIVRRVSNANFSDGRSLVGLGRFENTTASQLLSDYWYELTE